MSATDMNAHSSRSHTVFTTFFEQHGGRAADGGKTPVRFSKCTLIDLAGSEKWKSHHMTKFSAQRIKELTSINQVSKELVVRGGGSVLLPCRRRILPALARFCSLHTTLARPRHAVPLRCRQLSTAPFTTPLIHPLYARASTHQTRASRR